MGLKKSTPAVSAAAAAAWPQALIAQVRHDTALLRERVGRLTGAAGRERLAAALEAVRAQVEADLEEMGSDASWDSESVGSRWVCHS